MDAPSPQVTHLLDALACGAALIDRAGRIAHVNPRAAALAGRAPGELVGRTLESIYPDAEARALVAEALADMNSPREGEFYVVTPAGERVPVMMSGRAWQDPAGGGGPTYYAVTLTDIRPLKRTHDELRNQYRIIAEVSNTILDEAVNLKGYSEALENRVRERTAELHEANMDAIYMLAVASESKDEDTGAHVRRLERYSRTLARELGFGEREAEKVGYSAILHDVGKIHVPDHILKKPGPLTDDERRVIQEHTLAGERILSVKPFFGVARRIARHHHENWDGSGYPDRAAGGDIPVEARIVHLADVYDALTTPRVYKRAWDGYSAAAVIGEAAGRMFDPEVVRAFESLRARGAWEATEGNG
jgi:PAS domain S-box-containing protein